MNKEVNRHEQLTFNFDKEIPSLLEPLQEKEKKLGVLSPELIPLKIKLIKFYLEKEDLKNTFKHLRSVIEIIFGVNPELPPSNYFKELFDLATVVDKHTSGAGMVVGYGWTPLLNILNLIHYSLGCMYTDGEGVKQDIKEAVKWFRKAAEQGYASAQYSLGSMYDIELKNQMYSPNHLCYIYVMYLILKP